MVSPSHAHTYTTHARTHKHSHTHTRTPTHTHTRTQTELWQSDECPDIKVFLTPTICPKATPDVDEEDGDNISSFVASCAPERSEEPERMFAPHFTVLVLRSKDRSSRCCLVFVFVKMASHYSRGEGGRDGKRK